MTAPKFLLMFLCAAVIMHQQAADGALAPPKTREMIDEANRNGPYLGLVIPNLFEMNPLLQSPHFKPSNITIDFSGRRFRFGTIFQKQVILVLTGLGMINAGVTTQILLSSFDVEGVLHYGTAANVNPSLHIGDVTIPQYWAHTALWNWQRYEDGPEDELGLEKNGDYTREIGYLNFSNYTTNMSSCSSSGNLLNNVWYQPEEVFPVDGIPEEREHAFWIPVDPLYFQISRKLEGLELERCLNSTTCLTETPKVVRVSRGSSASFFLSNAAYQSFLYDTFKVSPVDMESASVALICLQQRTPFIAFRALSGGRSPQSDKASTFLSLASNNSVTVVLEFIKELSANIVVDTGFGS